MHPDLRSIRGVLFDLWNTLAWSRCETNPMVLIAGALGILEQDGWRKTLERGMMRRPFLGIREALAALETDTGLEIGAPERESLIRRWNEACAATCLYEDALPAVEQLRPRFRLGILSNTQSFDIDFIRSLGLSPRMDVICLSCDEGRLKPDPAIYATAVERLGPAAEEVLMVGDNVEDDVKGALEAGLQAVHLDRAGEAPPVPGAAAAVRQLTEISSLLS